MFVKESICLRKNHLKIINLKKKIKMVWAHYSSLLISGNKMTSMELSVKFIIIQTTLKCLISSTYHPFSLATLNLFIHYTLRFNSFNNNFLYTKNKMFVTCGIVCSLQLIFMYKNKNKTINLCECNVTLV